MLCRTILLAGKIGIVSPGLVLTIELKMHRGFADLLRLSTSNVRLKTFTWIKIVHWWDIWYILSTCIHGYQYMIFYKDILWHKHNMLSLLSRGHPRIRTQPSSSFGTWLRRARACFPRWMYINLLFRPSAPICENLLRGAFMVYRYGYYLGVYFLWIQMWCFMFGKCCFWKWLVGFSVFLVAGNLKFTSHLHEKIYFTCMILLII